MWVFRWLIGIVLAGIAGCDLDPNESFNPRTRAAFFLLEESPGNLSVLRVEDSTFIPGWEQVVGLGPGEVSGFALQGSLLWIGSASRRQVLKWDLESNSLASASSFSGFSPHYLCAGDRYLLLSDTTLGQIAFFDPQSGQIAFQTGVQGLPGPAEYRSAKFFVSLDDSLIAIYHELAFSLLNQLALPAPLIDFQWDNSNFLYAYSWDSSLLSSRIDYNANSLDETLRLASTQVRLSPFFRQQTGKEWTEDLYLQAQELFTGRNFVPLAKEVDNFEVDFFSARVYFQRNDSLLVMQLPSRELIAGFPLTEEIRKAGYYQDFVGE